MGPCLFIDRKSFITARTLPARTAPGEFDSTAQTRDVAIRLPFPVNGCSANHWDERTGFVAIVEPPA